MPVQSPWRGRWSISLIHVPASRCSLYPIGQTIWLQATTTNKYVSAHTDQINTPLEVLVTQAWEEFDVVDAGNGLITLRAHARNNYISARINQTNSPLQAVATQIQFWEQCSWLPRANVFREYAWSERLLRSLSI